MVSKDTQFDKDTKYASATSSCIVCNKYIVNGCFMHREVVIHAPAWSSTEVLQCVAKKCIVSHEYQV